MDILQRLIESRRTPAPAAPSVTKPSALDLITQLTGKTVAELEAAAQASPSFGVPEEVKDGPEFRRILALPRRVLDFNAPEVAKLVDDFTEAFRTPSGTMRLKPIQAVALAEIYQYHGLLGPIRVGGGKTLISYLAPVVFSVPKLRPMLIIPAKLKRKTEDSFRELAKHWRGPDPATYRIETYERLGRHTAGEVLGPKGERLAPALLDKYRPDILVLDEAHKAKNKGASCSRKILRYIRENPGVVVVALSGTLFRRSLKDFAPLAEGALPRTCPVPTAYGELESWAGALDEKVSSLRRVLPGPLVQFCTPEERATGPDITALRSGFGRRLVETPGVVASKDGPLEQSLVISEIRIDDPDPKIDGHFQIFRETWTTPAGIDVPDGITFKRHALEMALGFEYFWDPQPPEDWLAIRRAFNRLCREVIKHNRRNIDSVKAAVLAIEKGLYPGIEVLTEWRKIEPTFKPNTVSSWFSSEVLEFAQAWAEEHKGLIWVDHSAFGRALSEIAGIPYFGPEGKTPEGVYIMDAKKGYPAIASVKSNSEGRDLQYLWCDNLLVSPPSNGLAWEQLLARTHRDGQPAEEVTADWIANCSENLKDFAQACLDARAQEAITGQPQKLRYADIVRSSKPARGARWGEWE